MRPANPNSNPGGKIFGENGPVRPKSAESVFGPKLGEIRFNRPASIVGFTPEASAKAEVGTTFAQARARNQAQISARKAENRQVADAFIASALPNVRRANLNQSVDFKGFQSISKAKELDHVQTTKEKILKQVQNDKGVVESPRVNAKELVKKITRPQVRLNTQELAATVARLKAARNRQAEISQQTRVGIEANNQNTLRVTGLVERLKNHVLTPSELAFRARVVLAAQVPDQIYQAPIERNNPINKPIERPQVHELPKPTIDQVHSFTNLRPLVEKGVLSEDQAMQRAGVIGSPRVETPKGGPEAPKITLPKVDGISPKQAEQLATLAPIVREGNQTVREQVLAAVGIKPEIGQKFVEILQKSDSKVNHASESPAAPQESPPLGQAMRLIKTLDVDFETVDEAEVKKKAQALIAVIGQTYQLNALGKTESDTTLLVERQLASSDAVPQRIRSRVSSLMVRTIREVTVDPTEDPAKKALHQVDLEKQNKRVKLATKSIDEAPRNEQGEIARDFVIGQIQENNNQNYWGRLAVILKQNFDGSLDEMVVRLKKLKFWENAQTVAKTIDDSMSEYPAVEPAFKQTTKEVGRKEVGKTMDPLWSEMIRSLVKTLIVTPQTSQMATAR
jgi:hypothetical protein